VRGQGATELAGFQPGNLRDFTTHEIDKGITDNAVGCDSAFSARLQIDRG
jgi:hypothetical protein